MTNQKSNDELLTIFNNLVADQSNYGGRKYALAGKTKRESTDELFDDFGKGWLFGTMGKYCYDEQTEILTDKGWKFFKDLDKTEEVATLNTQDEVVWQKPCEYQEIEYNLSYLYLLKNQYIDLCITPFHQIYYRTRKGQYKLGFIEDIVHAVNGRYYFKLLANYKGKEELFFHVPVIANIGLSINFKQTRIRKYVFKMDDWLEFLGWFISEGSTTYSKNGCHYSINIAQDYTSNNNKYCQIDNLLSRMQISYNKHENGFVINDKTLFSYLKQFGKSNEKFIPLEIKNLSKRQLEILLFTLVKGDGHNSNNKYFQYFTVSDKLANDITEIAFKCGYHSTVNRVKTKNFNGFDIHFRVHYESILKEIKRIKIDKPIKVYDVTVPKYHTLYVRRNFKPCWSGNCLRFRNLARERDLLKIACYLYLLWLKKGFHITPEGLKVDVLDTYVKQKEENFTPFLEKIQYIFLNHAVYFPYELKQEYDAMLDGIYASLKLWSNANWSQIGAVGIYLMYYKMFLIWKDKYGATEVHDTDTGKT